MFNRKNVKEEAKLVFKANYWKIVLVALIIAAIGGSAGAVGAIPSSVATTARVNNANKYSNDYSNNYKYNYISQDDLEDVIDDELERKLNEQPNPEAINEELKRYGININDDALNKMNQSTNYYVDVEDGNVVVKVNGDEVVKSQVSANENGVQIHYEDSSNGTKTDVNLSPEDVNKIVNTTMNEAKRSEEIAEGMGAAAVGLAAGVLFVVIVVSIIVAAISICLTIFVFNPLSLGCKKAVLQSYDEPTELKNIGGGFKYNYGNNVKVLFLKQLFIFLWSLLFIIPGIIKAYEYRMIPYLIIENPEMTYKEAFAKSKMMMKGNKWDTFVFDLSYIGWVLLSFLTCGILSIFYVNPYYLCADANLYRAIKEATCSKVEASVNTNEDVLKEDSSETVSDGESDETK